MPGDRIILDLAAVAAAIAGGDHRQRLPTPDDPELRRLVESVNAIVETLAFKEQLLGENIQSLQNANRELREAQESLLQSEKLAAVGRVSAGIAHEIGNPIGAILGYLDLLKRKPIDDPDLKDSLSRIASEAWRINVIIREMLDFARPSALVLEELDVNAILTAMLDDLSRQSAFAAVTFARYFTSALPRVEADGQRLRQVLVNLITNARDAMDGAGPIRIATRKIDSEEGDTPVPTIPPRRRSDPPEIDYSHLRPALSYDPTSDRPLADERWWVEIRVSDRGAGIPAEMLREVFDPFFTTKPPGQGTGLGLPLSLSIVRSFRGRIRIESESGAGTTVAVQIPAALDEKDEE